MLTDEERDELEQFTANGTYRDFFGSRTAQLFAAVERIVTARVSAALREAAEAWYSDLTADENEAITDWLRARAASYDRGSE